MTEVSDKPINKGDVIELEIESLAFGAEGVGHLKTDKGSLAVFVEDTVPGDIVKIRIGTMKRKFARGYIVDFIKKSPLRITPRCKHFGSCGGCALQFIDYATQLKIKEQHVKDAITRLGGFEETIVKPIIGCKEPWYYRNKMEFSFSREFKDGVEGRLTLGLHVRRRHHDVTELSACFLMNDYIGGLVTGVRDFFRKKDEKGRLKEISLLNFTMREGKNSGEVMANLTGENGEPDFLDEFAAYLRDFFAQLNGGEQMRGLKETEQPIITPKLVSVYFTQIINFKGRPKKTMERLLWGREFISESLKTADGTELKFRISPRSFFQPNTRQAEVLYGLAIEAAAPKNTDTVFDLFCGAGTIGCFCARRAGKVYGIELNESAVKNARDNADDNGIKNIEFISGDVGKLLGTIGKKPDTVIVDPPRNGMDPKAVEMIVSYAPDKIVYVSCNPSTLARDLGMLKKTGYRLLSVQPVDMFPQTYHIECVALMEK
jgi:23S rRNA (uracil1939-C5)-methyltransferase